jgi:hypothetical protein
VFAEHDGLTQAALHDVEHRNVARRAVGASSLGVIGGADSIALVRQLMREDPDYELRLIAARVGNHWGEMSRTGFGPTIVPPPAPLP